MKWLSIAWELIRDVVLTGFGVWVIWKQVYQPVPNAGLLVVALGCITPAARSAVATVLSGPGSSSASSHRQPEQPSEPSPPPGGGTDGQRG